MNKEQRLQRIFAFLIPILVALMPMLLFWEGNAVELGALQGVWPVLLSALVGFGVAAAVWYASGKHYVVTALMGAVISFCLMDFSAFIKLAGLLPFLPVGVAALLLAAVVLAGTALALCKIRDLEIVSMFLPVLCMVMGALTVFNTVMTVFQLIPELPKQPVVMDAAVDRPNVYFIVSDEMGDFYTMDKYYDIPVEENEFRNYLLEKGFNISSESYSYRNHTTWCTADLTSLDYVSELDMTNNEARTISREHGLIFEVTSALGYGNAQVSSHEGHYPQLPDLSGEPFSERLVSTITFDGETILDVFIQRSILSLVKAFTPEGQATFLDRYSASILDKRMDRAERWFHDPSSYDHEGPLFVYGYFLVPHTPFYCDAEGNAHPADQRCNWSDPAYYRGAWEYTASFYQRIFDSIIANDPEAIIILMSDHGVRGGLYTTETIEIELPDQCRVVNAVYYGGEEFDIEGLSQINTMRAILSSLGADFPPIEDPDFMYYQDSPLFATGG